MLIIYSIFFDIIYSRICSSFFPSLISLEIYQILIKLNLLSYIISHISLLKQWAFWMTLVNKEPSSNSFNSFLSIDYSLTLEFHPYIQCISFIKERHEIYFRYYFNAWYYLLIAIHFAIFSYTYFFKLNDIIIYLEFIKQYYKSFQLYLIFIKFFSKSSFSFNHCLNHYILEFYY